MSEPSQNPTRKPPRPTGPYFFGVYDTDNFGGDYPNEKWIIQPVHSKDVADKIANALNSEMTSESRRYHQVGDRNYKLQPGFEP